MDVTKQFEQRIKDWAQNSDEVRAILVVGSRARRDHPGDRWADLDVIIFADKFDKYLTDPTWLSQFGQIWAKVAHQTEDGDQEWLVLYEDFYKVDFLFYRTSVLELMTDSNSMPDVYRRGYYVLVDKDAVAKCLPRPSSTAGSRGAPNEREFMALVETFWYGVVYVAKQIWRRDLWIVKYRDWTIKEQLLKMMEWYARAANGWAYDTWHDGRFLPEWVDPRTFEELQACFGRFDAADSWRALFATMRLFRRIAVETALKLGYPYPNLLDERVARFVDTVSNESGFLEA